RLAAHELESSAATANELGILQQNPEVLPRIRQERSNRTDCQRALAALPEATERRTVESDQALIGSNPEITVGALGKRRDPAARKAPLRAPRVVHILRYHPVRIDREAGNGKAQRGGTGK